MPQSIFWKSMLLVSEGSLVENMKLRGKELMANVDPDP